MVGEAAEPEILVVGPKDREGAEEDSFKEQHKVADGHSDYDLEGGGQGELENQVPDEAEASLSEEMELLAVDLVETDEWADHSRRLVCESKDFFLFGVHRKDLLFIIVDRYEWNAAEGAYSLQEDKVALGDLIYDVELDPRLMKQTLADVTKLALEALASLGGIASFAFTVIWRAAVYAPVLGAELKARFGYVLKNNYAVAGTPDDDAFKEVDQPLNGGAGTPSKSRKPLVLTLMAVEGCTVPAGMNLKALDGTVPRKQSTPKTRWSEYM